MSLPATSPTTSVAHMELLDKLEQRMVAIGCVRVPPNGETVALTPVKHHFTPGLYAREIFMPAGTFLTSQIHKTEHQFVVASGECWVLTEHGWEYIKAPHHGITKAGTRRFLAMITDTVWITFHATDLTDPEAIAREILDDRQNPLLENV